MPLDASLARSADAAGELRLQGVSVRRGGRTILDIPYWSLPIAGGVTVLVGPNGAGKSTLLRVLHGLVAPDAGRLDWARDQSPRRAFLLQSPVLLRRSASANLDFVLKRRKLTRAERQTRIDSLLAAADLASRADQPARSLSGGQQRRLALALALAQEPELLLLDEPTAGLDPTAATKVERMIADAASAGLTIVLSTHNAAEARRLGARLLFLHAGRPVEDGGLPETLDHPKTPELEAFLAGELTW